MKASRKYLRVLNSSVCYHCKGTKQGTLRWLYNENKAGKLEEYIENSNHIGALMPIMIDDMLQPIESLCKACNGLGVRITKGGNNVRKKERF